MKYAENSVRQTILTFLSVLLIAYDLEFSTFWTKIVQKTNKSFDSQQIQQRYEVQFHFRATFKIK